jgi:carbamoyl-phosphate synthase small subunit
VTARISFVNANDRTCEGVDYRGQKCFTVQFTPSADTSFLYDQFTIMMGGAKNA